MKRVIEFMMGLRIDVLLLIALMTGVLIQSLLFFVDIPCSGWPMWLAFGGMSVLLAAQSWRRAAGFVGVTVCALVLTAYTFSYTAADAVSCHFPMQDLLRNGWNPVYQSTIEDFRSIVGDSNLATMHVLFMPRLVALCGALIASSTNLFVADSFLNYALLFSLCATAFRFSKRMFSSASSKVVVHVLFAFAIAFTTKFTAFLCGYIDYAVYAAVLIMILSAACYWKDRQVEDLLLFCLGLVIAATTKPTGLLIAVLFIVASVPFLYRDRRFRFGCIFAAVIFLIICFSPLVTSLIHYGSPLYPAVSFDDAHPAIDLTNDFSGNADALRMGYLARTCYAWISPALTTKLCALFYGQPSFSPEFTVFAGVDGFWTSFRFLLGLSVLSLIFSRKNAITLICAFLFITTFVVPLKYIGYSRYFLQVWAIPPLAIFNFVAHPVWKNVDAIWSRAIRYAVLLIPVSIAAFCFARSIAFYGRTLGMEKDRQVALSEMKSISKTWRIDKNCPCSYTIVQRMNAEGLDCQILDPAISNDLPLVNYYAPTAWASAKSAEAEAHGAEESYPLANSPSALLRFPWRKASGSFQHLHIINSSVK